MQIQYVFEEEMKKLKDLIPRYAVIPLISIFVLNMAVYYLSKPFVFWRDKFDLSLPIDYQIPLLTPFMIIYLLAFVQWGLGYIIIARENREMCARAVSSDLIAKVICFLFFVILPTEIQRPEVTDGGLIGFVTKFVYWIDTPVNLFPSIHCLESYSIMRFTFSLKKVPLGYKIVMAVFSFAVFASVLFTRQHFLIDIPAGILVLEIGIILSKITKFDKVVLKHTLKY